MTSSESSLFGDIPRPISMLGNAEDELFTLALGLVPGVGARRGSQLIAQFGSSRAVLDASRKDLENCGLSGTLAQSIVSGCSFDQAIDQLELARSSGTRILTLDGPDYPARLRNIADPPLVLFARGNLKLAHSVCIGVVGTRRPSTYGKAVAGKLGRELSDLGVTVVSGMARGIDTIAHTSALEGRGSTIAVFGCGVDVIYPAENRGLAADIANRGLILSEFPMGSPSYPQNFPVRNRIVSGIGLGILVVEGAQYSGSAITARIASEQNRATFAVPGNITSKMSWGPNLLIKQGAILVQDAMDVLNHFPPEIRATLYQDLYGNPADGSAGDFSTAPTSPASDTSTPRSPAELQILRALRVDEGKTLDDLLEALPAMSSSEIIAALFQLEMEGAIKQDAGQRYTKLWC